jgi:hypothetical protein
MNKRIPFITFFLLLCLIGTSAIGLQTAAVQVAALQSAAQTSTKATAKAPVIIPFELNGRHIYLKGKVNSQPLTFVLDTGDQVAILDLDVAKRMNLDLSGGEVRAGGAGAAVLYGARVKDASFTLDGLEGFSQTVKMALPLGPVLSPRSGRPFEGIIGQEFIQEFVVEIDYQARVLKLHDKEKFVYTGPGESVPIDLVHGHPILEAEVTPVGSAPLKGKFVFDIGAGLALALYSPFVAENRLLGPEVKTIRSLGGAGAGGDTTGRIGRVSDLKIGNYRIKGPTTLFSEDKAGAFASKSLAGNIGARVANKFRVFLDYDRKRIIFEPNSTFAAPYDHAQIGMSLIAEGSDFRTFRVRAVLENAPASEAGLQKDDIITSVNGQSAAELTLTKLDEMFERPVPYKLTIRRGEQTLSLTVTPRRLV